MQQTHNTQRKNLYSRYMHWRQIRFTHAHAHTHTLTWQFVVFILYPHHCTSAITTNTDPLPPTCTHAFMYVVENGGGWWCWWWCL